MRALGERYGRGVVVARWRHDSARVSIPTADAVRVVLSLSSGQRIRHSERGRTLSAPGLPGHVSVFPAGISTDTIVEGEADIVQVFIKPQILGLNADKPLFGSSVFESTNERLKQTAIALFVAIECDDLRRRDVAEIDLIQVLCGLRALPISAGTEAARRGSPSLAIDRFEQVIDEVARGLTVPPLRVEELAAAGHLSVSHFIRSVRQTIGSTPHQLVMLRRDERAMTLLGERELSVAEVADAVGYASPAHFVASFRHRFGVTPGAYRQALSRRRSA